MRPFVITMKDGARVRLQAVGPGDRERLLAGFARLSPRSRYLRFRRPVTELSEADIRDLTDTDARHHVAWGAIALDEPGEPGIGVARYLRSLNDGKTAEVAVTVVDEWQRRGVGRVLVETLLLAALENGIERLMARVLPENTGARRLLQRVGARPERHDGQELVLELPVRRRDRTLLSSLEFRAPTREELLQGAGGERESLPTMSRIRALMRLL